METIYPFISSWLLVTILLPLTIWIMWRFKVVDDPKNHKHIKVIHTYPVPRGGGLAIMIAILVCFILFLPLDSHGIAILLACLITVIVGIIDDYKDISPYIRLITNGIAALIIISQGIMVNYITNPITLTPIDLNMHRYEFNYSNLQISIPFLSIIITFIWIVGMMNMIGQGAGGVEGQLPGVVFIASTVIAIMSSRYSADITLWPVEVLGMIVAGSYLAFTAFNFFPQRIMPGYSGKSLAGLLLAVMALLSTAKIGLIITVLGVPIVDTLIIYFRRIWARKSPLIGDRNHLHHLFLDKGISKPKIVILYWLMTASLGLIALNINSRQKLYTLVLVAVSISLLILTLRKKTLINK